MGYTSVYRIRSSLQDKLQYTGYTPVYRITAVYRGYTPVYRIHTSLLESTPVYRIHFSLKNPLQSTEYTQIYRINSSLQETLQSTGDTPFYRIHSNLQDKLQSIGDTFQSTGYTPVCSSLHDIHTRVYRIHSSLYGAMETPQHGIGPKKNGNLLKMNFFLGRRARTLKACSAS